MDLPDPCTWLFTGDSITCAAHHTHGARGWTQLVEERVRYELYRRMDVFLNVAVSGWTAADMLAHADRLVTPWGANLHSISFGTNDASVARAEGTYTVEEFHENLLALAGLTPQARLVINTPCLVLSSHRGRPQLADYAEACRDVARETGALLVDHETAWRARFGEGEPTDLIAAGDEIHPNAAGHAFMAHTFLTALGLD